MWLFIQSNLIELLDLIELLNPEQHWTVCPYNHHQEAWEQVFSNSILL